jgi:hypothetical protein
MSRNKNAKRVYLVAPAVAADGSDLPMPTLPSRVDAMAGRNETGGVIDEGAWATLAKYISSVSDETDEETDDTGLTMVA